MGAAVVFPGQGSQSPGMGRELYAAFPECRAVFDEAGLEAIQVQLAKRLLEPNLSTQSSDGIGVHEQVVASRRRR